MARADLHGNRESFTLSNWYGGTYATIYTHTHTHRAPCTRHAFHFSVRSIEDAEGARTQLLCLPTA